MIRCLFENDHGALLRHAVVDCLVLKGDQILLVHRAKELLEGGKWALPGGYVERDETVFDATAREVLEETGWTIKKLCPLLINSSPDRQGEDRQNVAFVFTATAVDKVGNPDWESDEVKWFDLSTVTSTFDLAFDHAKSVSLYLSQKNNPVTLPIIL